MKLPMVLKLVLKLRLDKSATAGLSFLMLLVFLLALLLHIVDMDWIAIVLAVPINIYTTRNR